jgi:nucleotide-binding universal stress UspA family protein
MYQRIVVPLDGSALAEASLSYAEALAHLGPNTLHLVQAVPPGGEAEATTYLGAVAARLRAHGRPVETIVAPGDAADTILWQVRSLHADLVVMSTHGRSGAARWLLGSVASEVLHRSARPVLLVRSPLPAADKWPRRVLVPLDGSELAEQGLGHARVLARADGEILLYQALAPAPLIVENVAQDPELSQLLTARREQALRYLENMATPLRTAGYHVRTAAEHGVAAPRIAAFARQEQVDLVVVSSHGRAGTARWLLGSVADELVQATSAPLLILRPLSVAAHRSIADARPAARPLDAQPTPPPATLALTGRQVQLVRVALDNLLWEVTREAPLSAEIEELLARLPRYRATERLRSPAGRQSPAPGLRGSPTAARR